MPLLDWEPGQSPEAPGTLYFYEQGKAPSSGFRADSSGSVLAPGNDALVWPGGEFGPADLGYKGWAYDPALCAGGSIATSGTVYLTKHPIRRDAVLSALHWAVTTVGVTPTAGQNWIGAYDPSGNPLGSVGVDADVTSTGVKNSQLATPAQLLAEWGFFWQAYLFNAGTAPTVARASTFASTPNAGTVAATYRFCVNGTGATALPATINPASNALNSPLTLWGAWS